MKGMNMVQIHIHHIALQTANFDKAFWFYSELLGLRLIKGPLNYKNTRTLAWLDAGSIMIELYSVKQGQVPQPYDDRRVGTDHIALEVDDLDALLRHLRKYNIKISREPFLPPTDEPNQPRIAFIEGADGEEIEIRECIHLEA
jgi:catechol 2,3-dioxygenase-like lactoylglutathione lyase family enzyme